MKAISPARSAASPASALSATASSMFAALAIAIRSHCSTVRHCPARTAQARRPLDIFPSSIIASSLVQKSYSANFPGEFGGGVINLTTRRRSRASRFSPSAAASGGEFGNHRAARLHLLWHRQRLDRLRRRWPQSAARLCGVARIRPAHQRSASISRRSPASSSTPAMRCCSRTTICRSVGQRHRRQVVWTIGDAELGLIATAGYDQMAHA